MKLYIYKITTIAAFLCLSVISYAQTPFVGIANWQGNKPAAVCVTLDDGCINQFLFGQAVLDSHGIKGSFNIITNLKSNCDGGNAPAGDLNYYQGSGSQYWDLLQTAINKGHEIGDHTVTHPYLDSLWHDTTKVPGRYKEWRDTVGQEIGQSKVTLEQELYEPNSTTTHYNILTFAYPYGSGQNTRPLVDTVQKYFIGARAAGTHSSTLTWDTYADALATPDTVTKDSSFFNYYYQVESYGMTNTTTSKWFAAQLDSTIKNQGWFIPMYHNIGNTRSLVDSDLYTVSDTAFSHQMDSLALKKDSLWIAPFRDVLRYSKENISTSIDSVRIKGDSVLTAYVSDSIKNPIFNVPLTFVISNWGCACDMDSIVQTGTISGTGTKTHKKLAVAKGTKGTIQFNAVVDSGGVLTLYKSIKVVTGIIPSADTYFELYQNVPNPTSATTAISYSLKQAGNVQLELFDITGTTSKTLVSESQEIGKHSYSLNTESLQAGVYFYRLSSGGVFDVKKMVVIK